MLDAWELTPAAVDGAEPLGTVRLGDVGRSLWKTARRSRGSLSRATGLAAEAARITVGRSAIAPDRKDWRFTDATWQDNQLYRRVMQYYLAWAESMEAMVSSANLDWRAEERARFFMGIAVSAAAPTNTFLGNPVALKRALETSGGSLVSGLRNFIDDQRHNGGMPAQVRRDAFVIGKDLAASPGAVIYRDEICEVLQFAPSTPQVHVRPLVVIPPQINKYYFMDLAPGRSFIEYTVSRGITCFLISWRNPDGRHADWDFDTYAAAALRAIDVARDTARSDDVNVIGMCAGGILTATVLNHLAHTSDERVATATLGVTLLDFSVPTTVGLFNTAPLMATARGRSQMRRGLDGRSLGSVFSWLRPNELVWNYWVNNYLLGKQPPVFDILAWNSDPTNLPAALHRQFLEVFQDNTLVNPGAFKVLGTPVDLGKVTVETYVTGAVADHLTPWKGCYRSTQLLGGSSTFVLSYSGHIASLVNPPGNPKAHFFAGPEPEPDPDAWQAKAQKVAGTWWEHWVDWAIQRSGDTRRSPTSLGSRKFRVIEPAPGAYVRGLEPSRG
ncbi:MAG TPA: alpha/beta fold hydrolase [Mycobacterium sp.]|nr:alpha/beta fold hydrolase [Mycobacterium sp.]